MGMVSGNIRYGKHLESSNESKYEVLGEGSDELHLSRAWLSPDIMFSFSYLYVYTSSLKYLISALNSPLFR